MGGDIIKGSGYVQQSGYYGEVAAQQRLQERQNVLAENALCPIAQPSMEEIAGLQGYYNGCLSSISQLRYGTAFPDLNSMMMQNSQMMMFFLMYQQMQMQNMLLMMMLVSGGLMSGGYPGGIQGIGGNGMNGGCFPGVGFPSFPGVGSTSGQGYQGSGGGKTGGVGSATGQLVTVSGEKVDSGIASNLQAMIAAAKQDGVNLDIISGFRSRGEQEALYAKYGPGRAAKPGTSNHEKGLAVDFANTPGAYKWLSKNASRFGLQTNANSGGWEQWHVSPTGA
ncbi:MAG: D-alanyl-D-alanine carboxypeptidase family protein [Candidatus Eremiobacteraeota bacterium]|nr:D-alanyl-D-alanine carboxypeptidase family protein [Candidatus Eremiobacteraeota bacterium]